MKCFISVLAILFMQSSCSSLSISKNKSQISFQAVEQIKLGKDSKIALENKFGKPDDEHSIDSDKYVVFYNRPYQYEDGSWGQAQRASFVLSKKSDQVLAALWIPNNEDEMGELSNVKAYFGSAKFSVRKHELAGKHESPLEYSLIDRQAGISIDVGTQNQKVYSVNFYIPTDRVVSSTKQ